MNQQYYNRSWLDGCFDFMHFGHANAILQSRMTANDVNFSMFPYTPEDKNVSFTKLDEYTFFDAESLKEHFDFVAYGMPRSGIWVGLHSDEEIAKNKGSLPVMNLLERCYHVSNIRWVTSHGVVKNVPYVTELEHGVNDALCEYVLHGDDLVCDADGKDCYDNVRKENRFLIVKRTEGVSTTEIIQRILLENYKNRDNLSEYNELLQNKVELKLLEKLCLDENAEKVYCSVFDESFDNIVIKGEYFDYSEENTIYYNNPDRSFDMMNAGDIEVLSKIKEKYQKKIIVALNITNAICVNNIRERLFSLVSCSLVDGVIINPSSTLRHNFIEITIDDEFKNRVFQYLTPETIKERIINSKEIYEARNKKKLNI
ncbi:uncharacterized protein HGUI_00926 [Hanseniaspora guilliermondii]|uniref:ethanolamine-phosphate cytidylyltransferase n=1 Tax=Hanseniaspora guilliermondii TaxID=56406 RepID=A0A1L0FGK5_9ASCO|nr:uncharacterized protein HGUI_00926 [Hanseniaspora guilliermondii]